MKFFVYKTNDEVWDRTESIYGFGGWGPVRTHRGLLEPGDVIITYELKRKLVFAVSIATTGGFHWSSFFDRKGVERQGWFTDSITLAIAPVEPTTPEQAACQGLRGSERVGFKVLPDDIGVGLYDRIMAADAEGQRDLYLAQVCNT